MCAMRKKAKTTKKGTENKPRVFKPTPEGIAKHIFVCADALVSAFSFDDRLLYNLMSMLPGDVCNLLGFRDFYHAQYLRHRIVIYGIGYDQEAEKKYRGKEYVMSNVYVLNPELRHMFCCEAVREKLLLDTIKNEFLPKYKNKPEAVALAQIVAMFENDDAAFDQYEKLAGDEAALDRYNFVRRCPVPLDWLSTRTPRVQDALLREYGVHFVRTMVMLPAFVSLMERKGANGGPAGKLLKPGCEALYAYWKEGDAGKALALCGGPCPSEADDIDRQLASTCILCFAGRSQAIEEARLVYYRYKKLHRLRAALSAGYTLGLIPLLAFFLYGNEDDLAEMRASIDRTLKRKFTAPERINLGICGFYALSALDELRKGDEDKARGIMRSGLSYWKDDGNFLSNMLFSGAYARIDPQVFTDRAKPAIFLKELDGYYEKIPLYRRCIADILEVLLPEKEKGKWERDSSVPDGFINVTMLVEKMEPWKMCLTAMEELCRSKEEEVVKKKRLIWILHPKDNYVEPKVQQTIRNGWGVPRSVSLARLHEDPKDYDYLTKKDRLLLSLCEQDWWSVTLRLQDCCQELDGYPLVYTEKNKKGETRPELRPVTVRRGQLELSVKEGRKDTYKLSMPKMMQEYKEGRDTYYSFEDDVLTYYVLKERELKLAQLMANDVVIPREELPRVLSLTKSDMAVSLRADDLKAETIDGVSTPVVQLEQTPAGFAAKIGVRPLGRPGTMFFPVAEGAEEVLGTVPLDDGIQAEGEQKEDGQKVAALNDGTARVLTKTVRVKRSFADEQAAFEGLKNACPMLAANIEETYWETGNPEDVLVLLEELRKSPVQNSVEWPKGCRIRLGGTVDASSVKVRIHSASRSDWFDVTGDVQLDTNKMISLKGLISMMKGSRFVALGDGEYVSLTDDLRRKLSKLKLVTTEGKKDALQVNALAAGAIEQALEDIQLEADKPWQHSVERMNKAFSATPVLPTTLQAELRDYQREGYEWMQRLAIWGVGACLADDMGLGKTVQSIAVLLNQALKGPCLVVAPTSVCSNWEAEINRFAPTLTPYRLGLTDRQKTVNDLDANDVLIVGYGLLNNVRKELGSRKWAMIVFDEAQAMKNSQTKRARAAHTLDADFRLALTGTPIENRIDDLWSLFNIINPGLLGSWESFCNRYGTAAPGTSSSRSLRAVVRPFLLRRLKGAVLDELPEKTEQNILIEPNDKEKAFYETIRSNAVAKLAAQQAQGKGGSSRIAILAELTRLRRACCHPGLADPDMMNLEKHSSKTEQFLETVESLIASGHKVLAFSQFTTYLAMIRQALDEKGIRWQYLDGSTPEKDRKASVAAFQRGEGDVFLLSLKAGGMGINLTAADYVIHLDPWWNPAVEDQASDRAHRIGQKRPVTIYRMIQRGSVEEKILQLHGTKRELAAEFLEGTESAVTHLTEEDLLNLMR